MRLKKKQLLLPLMQSLMGMTPAQRTIILQHLDDHSQDMLIDTVQYVLQMGPKKLKKDDAGNLSHLLKDHKCDLRYLCNHKKTVKLRRRRLKQMGGFPLGLVLSTAIPLLLSLFKKR